MSQVSGGVVPLVAMAAAPLAQTAMQKGMEQGAKAQEKGMQIWNDSTRRQETAIRGPIDVQAVNMTRYIIIAVVIISILLIYYGVGRKWVEPPKMQSVFDNFTPDRMKMVVPPADEMVSDSTRVFGVMPRRPIRVNV